MQPNIGLPLDKAKGTHLATRYIYVHLPHIGVGYTDDAPPTQESIHRPLTHTFSRPGYSNLLPHTKSFHIPK